MNKALCALAGSALALSLAGCTTNPAQAALVNGVGITDAQVTQTAEAIGRAEQIEPSQLRAAIVSNEAQGLVAAQVARANNLPLSETTRREVIGQNQLLGRLQRIPEASTFVNAAADAIYVSTKLGADKFLAGCQQVPVQVNPRYGNWSKELCGIAPNDSGSLSRPAPTRAAQS